jgi:hypothetical protein
VTTGPEGAFWNNWKNGLPASGGTISNSNASGAYAGFKGPTSGSNNKASTDPYAVEALNMKPADRLALSKLLKAAGYLKTASSSYNKKLGEAFAIAAQDAAVESAKTGRDLTIKAFLLENPATQSGTSGASNLPSRNVYQYTEADRIKIIDDVSQTLRGQGLTEEDKKQKWYTDLKSSIDNMIKTGTLSTTEKVYNPKTKKTEIKTVATPGFSQEKAAAVAESAIRKAAPEDISRQERVGFTDWMFKTLGGANG